MKAFRRFRRRLFWRTRYRRALYRMYPTAVVSCLVGPDELNERGRFMLGWFVRNQHRLLRVTTGADKAGGAVK